MTIKITATVVGAAQVERELTQAIPAALKSAVKAEMQSLAMELVRKVKTEKLTGQVLNVRTGNLRSSINAFPSRGVEEKPEGVLGSEVGMAASVGTRLWYGRMWELSGHKAYWVYPRKKKALFWKGLPHPVAYSRVPAEAPRPFLRPALDEMKERIVQRLQAVVNKALTGRP